VGRPPFEITDEVCKKAEALAAQGLTKEQIARCLGIHYMTLNRKEKKLRKFSEAIKSGQAKGIAQVTNYLMDNAKAGNATAQIFYLKNRSPGEWRDIKAVDVSNGGKSFEINITR
tara:strand:+ start:1011 stop:1355 length:345 start_codon:yes stop_codon:yes gene_type:complete